MKGKEIIIGVDGSAQSLLAVDLGAQEATLRRAPMRIVHAMRHPHPDAAMIVANAAARTRARHPDLSVTDEIIPGDPVEVLAATSADAAMIVLGERHDGFSERLLGSVLTGLLGRARVPVLVARGHTHPGGHVVVGVSGEEDERPTLAFAFAEASLRGAALLAVHAWAHPMADRLAEIVPAPYNVPQAEEQAAIVLSEALSGWRSAFPEVAVHRRVMHERTRDVLEGESARAQLVVVGGQGRGLVREALGGFLVREADCPVAVVPHVSR